MATYSDVLRIAEAELVSHVQEVPLGSNAGPRVEKYLKSVCLPAGNPWCAAFVNWCMVAGDIVGWPATGDTWAIRDWANERGVYSTNPLVGDVFLELDNKGDPLHTGFGKAVGPTTWDSIEGNFGDRVYTQSRYFAGFKFVHWQSVLLQTARYLNIYSHDGSHAFTMDGATTSVKGIKVNGVPFAGGTIVVGY